MEIRLCERCKKPFQSYFYERYCTNCAKKIEHEENMRRAAEGEDIDCTDTVICPWCGEETSPEYDPDESAFWQDGDHLMECTECGKPYRLETSVSISYSTSRTLSRWMKNELSERNKGK